MLKKIFYGFGGLSYSVISQTISNFFMFFATSVLGISGTLVGITIGISTNDIGSPVKPVSNEPNN